MGKQGQPITEDREKSDGDNDALIKVDGCGCIVFMLVATFCIVVVIATLYFTGVIP